jgi:2'-5' RNA ligase
MQDLDALYADIETRGQAAIRNAKESIDPHLSRMAQDQRQSLTLLINLHGPLLQNLQMLKREMQEAEPEQYYYPDEDIHVTVIVMLYAAAKLSYSNETLQQAIEIVGAACKKIDPFDINFRGIIASEEALLVPGYYQKGLLELRQSVRKIAQECGFALRERYQRVSAHTVLGRFMRPIQNREGLLARMEKYRDLEIGSVPIDEVELTLHDYYHHEKETIQKFALGVR